VENLYPHAPLQGGAILHVDVHVVARDEDA